MALAPTTILADEDSRVGEGTSHRYVCRLAEEDGTAIQVAAITDIRGWLDDPLGATINTRANVALLSGNGGSVSDIGGGVAEFTWKLDPADAVISAAGQVAGAGRTPRRRRRRTRSSWRRCNGRCCGKRATSLSSRATSRCCPTT